MRFLLVITLSYLLTACSGESEFEGKLFCANAKAYVVKYHLGFHLYRFDRTEVADKLCEGKHP